MDEQIIDNFLESDVYTIDDYLEDDFEITDGNGEKMLQKINFYNRCLPYYEQLERMRVKYWENLKNNLSCSMLSNNNDCLFSKWIDTFSSYISIYDLAFTKEEHIFLIKLFHNSLAFFEYDYQLSKKLIELLSRLLRETKHITRLDLELDWRVLYTLYENITNSKSYFSKDSTKEMLDEWKQYLCIHNEKYRLYMEYFSLFLPTLLPPEEHEFGFKLWLDDFIDMLNWSQVPYTTLSNLLARLAEDVYGYIDWEPYLPYFFQKLNSKPNIIYLLDCLKIFTWTILPSNTENFKKFLLIAKNSRDNFISKSYSFVPYALAIMITRRYKKEQQNLWFHYAHGNHKLDEKTINEIGAILLENFIDSYFCKTQSTDNYQFLYGILNLNHKLVAERIPEKLQIAYEQISEPWRLKAILKLYSVSIFPIIMDNQIGPKYRIELVPMLFQLIETFNTYDHDLCMAQLIAIKSILILEFPIIDCSSLCQISDKVLTEYELEMCLQSVRLEEFPIGFMRCCQNIIDSNNENLFADLAKMDSLSCIVFFILTRTSEKIAKAFIDNFFSFIISNIYENGYIVIKIIMNSIAMVYPDYMMKKLFPLISEHLKMLAVNKDIKLSKSLEKDLKYHVKIFGYLFYCNAELLSLYQEEILILLEEISHLNLDSNSSIVYNLLINLYNSLISEKNFVSVQELKPEMMMFENWPKLITIKEFSTKWHKQTTNGLNFAHRLLKIFIKNKLILLENWIETKIEMTNDELLKNLKFISLFDELTISSPEFLSFPANDSSSYLSNMDNPFLNDLIKCREHIIIVMHKVLTKLEKMNSDDTRSYKAIIDIYAAMLTKSSHFSCKKFKQIRLYERRTNPNEFLWFLHLNAANARDRFIQKELINVMRKRLTEMDITIMKNLISLSRSNYQSIRRNVKSTLAKIFQYHVNSSLLISDEIIYNLNIQDADSLIGVLDLLHLNEDRSLMFCSSWDTLLKLYPILIKTKFSEKPEITRIFDEDFELLFQNNYFMKPLEKNYSLESLFCYFEEGKSLNFPPIAEDVIEAFRQKIMDSNQNNRAAYNKLINQLLTIMLNENLHWRFYYFGFLLLNYLIRTDIDFPINGVRFFIHNLAHDLLLIRKIARTGLVKIMQIMLPKKITSRIEGLESINYDENDLGCLHNEEIFDRQLFLDKNHHGYYKNLPFKIKKFDSFEKNAQFEVLSIEFNKSTFLDKVFTLNSIENGTRISDENIKFWKLYFTLIKLEFSDQIFSRVTLLLDKHRYHYDKYALEVLCGLTKASKHFEYHAYKKFQTFFLTTNSVELSPFYQYEILLKLRKAIRDNWKYPMVSKNVRAHILENINHPYQQVRYIHGILLNYTFFFPLGLKSEQVNFDHNYNNHCTLAPIFQYLNEKLSILLEEKNSEIDVTSFKSDLLDSNTNNGLQLILPILCVIRTNNPVMSLINNAIDHIARSNYHTEEKIEQILAIVNKLSNNWNWRSRKTILRFLQIFIRSNNFLLITFKYNDQIEKIIVRLLTDETVEVRNAAFSTFSQLLENGLISDKRRDELIYLFRSKSSDMSSDISERHGSILGLCAFVYAFPNEIPDFIPEILFFLTGHVRSISVISNSVTKTLRFFKKHHIEDWAIHKRKFSSDQLSQLNDVLISPSYYC
ncbi:proteasome activator complex subunit 4-like protein 2 [Dermatophagoides farinae]|uniref:Proteasome activator complex subunit 4-like protein 2 n=1 Tax=Dermatophagoides farinae TaxID=6954 RepID=A0A9D4SL12_DERFA|nr:proteasome activator complex subunit 4-like protein 2 [Dermatophagoides farinae]